VLDAPVDLAQEGEPPAPGTDILYVETVIVILFGQQIGPSALLMAQEFGQGFDSGLFRSKAQLACRPFTGHCPVVLHRVAFGSPGRGMRVVPAARNSLARGMEPSPPALKIPIAVDSAAAASARAASRT